MDDRARLNDGFAAGLEHRHHPKRMFVPIGIGIPLLDADHPAFIGAARLFERPAHTQISHQPLRKRWDPAKAPYRDLFPSAHFRTSMVPIVSGCSPDRAPILPTTFFQPPLMLRNAESFFGVTKPECTRRSLVPPSTLARVQVTMVSRREPYWCALLSCPPCHEYDSRSLRLTSSTSQ